MRGSILRRGKTSWRLKFDKGEVNDKRQYHYETVRGTRREAEAALAKRLNEFTEGRYVAPTVETVGSYAMHWLEHIAPASRQQITVQRYATLVRAHIIPGLGDIPLQALDGAAIDRFNAGRRKDGRQRGDGGLSEMTLHHVSALLGQILNSAVKARKMVRSPMGDVETKPKPKRKKIEVLDEVELRTLLASLKGDWLYMPTLLAAYTGMRRGEVLGLRWSDIDFTKGTLTVAQSVERVGGAPRLKAPKTDRSRRTIKLPATILPELASPRRQQAEHRMKLGLGKDPLGLVFTSVRGKLIDPEVLSQEFGHAAAKVKPMTFHGLRHSHITALLRSGAPVHAVSARAGHSKPSITLDVYSHLIGGEDDQMAIIADDMMQRALK